MAAPVDIGVGTMLGPGPIEQRPGARRGARDRRGLPAPRPRGLSVRSWLIRVRAGPGATLPAVPKNLVIVESPAKARTIERYLGADYHVLASYGHVRDLPENPGKGKFGVDVDHDFAPSTSSPKIAASRSPRSEGGQEARTWSSSRPTLIARARRSPGMWPRRRTFPRERTRRVTFSRDHRAGDPRGVRPSTRHRPEPRRRPADAPDRGPARRLHAEPAALAQGPAAASRPAASSPWPFAWSSSASARSRAFNAREYWTIQALLATAAGETFPAELDPDRRGGARRSPTRRQRTRHVAAIRELRPVVTQAGPQDPEAITGRRRSRRPRSSRRPAASSASARSGRCRSRSACTRAPTRRTATSGSSPTCERTRPPSPGVAMGEAREVIAERYGAPVHDAQGPGLQDQDQGRPGGPRVDPADQLPS